MTSKTLQEVIDLNKQAFDCLANLEAFGFLDNGALMGLKDQLLEQSILLKRDHDLFDPPELSAAPARMDLTDRECLSILSGVACGLAQRAPIINVRRAVLYLAANDKFWDIVYYQPMTSDQVKLRQEAEGRTA